MKVSYVLRSQRLYKVVFKHYMGVIRYYQREFNFELGLSLYTPPHCATFVRRNKFLVTSRYKLCVNVFVIFW